MYDIIKRLIDKQIASKQMPECAMLIDVRREYDGDENSFRKELLELMKADKIVFKRVINGFSIYTT